MDQSPVQNIPNQDEETSGEAVPVPPPPHLKKYLPFILIGVIFLLLLLTGVVLLKGKLGQKNEEPTPTIRPTATPFSSPTSPPTIAPTVNISPTVLPIKKGRLVFIKDGDIHESDLSSASSTLLVKNATPAADKLSWSPMGRFLSWREKSPAATPSALVVYDLEKNIAGTLKVSSDSAKEFMDYAWSPDEKAVAMISKGANYDITLFSLPSFSPSVLIERASVVRQILWPEAKTLIFSGDDGISSINTTSSSAKILVSNNKVVRMKLSPQKDKILYSVGDEKKSDLYLVGIDGNNNQLIAPKPEKVDMGQTGLSSEILNNGFIPYALFMPGSERLLVGYNNPNSLPLVGVYDLTNKSFKAIAPFALRSSDVMINDDNLLGERLVITSGKTTVWQLSVYTMEKGGRLDLVRAILGASSPAYIY